MDKFSKLYIALKFRLKGMGFYQAMKALEFAKDIHVGLRKDGETPEFQHQLEIAHYILTLKDIEDLEGAIIVALLHDTDEDYPFNIQKLESFGDDRADAIRLLNKHRAPSLEDYFYGLSTNVLAAIVKGADRINNFQSMNRGNFTIEKQQRYADEVVSFFLPMLKTARKAFPRQMDTFYNIEFILKSQHELVMMFINAEEKNV